MFTMTCSAASDSIDEICNDSCTVLRLKSHFNNSLSVIYSPNATILLVYEAAKMEMSLVTKDTVSLLVNLWSACCLSRIHWTTCLRSKWSVGLSSWVNCTLYGCKCRSFTRIRCSELLEMSNCCVRRRMDLFWLTWTPSLTMAVFWTDLVRRRRSGVGMFAVDSVASNLLISLRTVDSLVALLQIGAHEAFEQFQHNTHHLIKGLTIETRSSSVALYTK